MNNKIVTSLVCFVCCSTFVATLAIAKTVKVQNSPRPFTVVPPDSWEQQPTLTGNSRIKFTSPLGTPPATCAVIVIEIPQLKDVPQSTFSQGMAEPPDIDGFTAQLSSGVNNVKVVSANNAVLFGFPSQRVNVQYSSGTPSGEIWFRGITDTTVTTPGISWAVSCGGSGKNLDEAKKAFSYWQSEIIRFPTNVKIQKK